MKTKPFRIEWRIHKGRWTVLGVPPNRVCVLGTRKDARKEVTQLKGANPRGFECRIIEVIP